jgi:segregation and condensation protein A
MGQAAPDFSDMDSTLEAEPFGLSESFRPDLEAYEGPLDVMLDLARRHRIDLSQVPIGVLVDQFLIWLNQVIAESRGLERGAGALIAVAWLVDLKIRSLIPGPKAPAFDPVDALRRQLMHLDMIRQCAAQLMGRNRLGHDVFDRGFSIEARIYRDIRRSARGLTKHFHVSPLLKDGQVTWVSKGGRALQAPSPSAELLELVEAGRPFARKLPAKTLAAVEPQARMVMRAAEVFAVDRAIGWFRNIVGDHPDGFDFAANIPPAPPSLKRSATAASLMAILEMAREEEITLRQEGVFTPLTIRRADILST